MNMKIITRANPDFVLNMRVKIKMSSHSLPIFCLTNTGRILFCDGMFKYIFGDNMHSDKSVRITGIGAALVDILVNESDRFLAGLGKEKGGMTLVEDKDIAQILSKTQNRPVIVPGGAACNTIMGVGKLGGKARFIGMRGDDEYGRIFENQLMECNTEPVLSVSELPTGRVLSVITPDAQRSMFTFLGASTQLMPGSITAEMFADTAIAMIEGYLLFNPELMDAALMAAKKAGCLVALDLASFEVVNSSKDRLDEIIKNQVDILIANEDEALAYTGHKDEERAVRALAHNVLTAVLKIGRRGSYIAHKGVTTKIEPVTDRPAIDTTGAGDLWAAGFLFGIAHGLSIEQSGKIGSACGYEVCQVIGARIPHKGWQKIKNMIKKFGLDLND